MPRQQQQQQQQQQTSQVQPQQAQSAGVAIEKRPAGTPVVRSDSIRGLLTQPAFKEQLGKLCNNPERFVRIALNQIGRNPKLQLCDKVSFFNCLLESAQLGIEPDGRNAHLIPYQNRRTGKLICTLIVDYKGLVRLALRSGNYVRLHADVVCENDVFEYNLGQVVRHIVDYRKPRGEVYAAYAIAVEKSGATLATVMTRHEIEVVRRRSSAANDGPWVTDYAEMCKKTVFKRLSKWLLLDYAAEEVIHRDNQIEGGALDVDMLEAAMVSKAPEPEPANNPDAIEQEQPVAADNAPVEHRERTSADDAAANELFG